ncbi:MAG: class I SAM-dependent methyltransferase [Verrucomicrobia bacterium]|nr:class I SAM-dependent methyltransferase [Verrucomicrobiota bacterium]
MAYIDFITTIHRSTKRDYVARVNEFDKAKAAEKAGQFGFDYWDGDRKFGYGGYRYDGRWHRVAEMMAKHYDLKEGARILDVGCGKGFLLYEFTQVIPGAQVVGIDVSAYAIQNAKEEVRPQLGLGNANALPFANESFDLVYSINTLHNLYINDLWMALKEIERVGRESKHVTVEAYRNEREKVNLLYWQLTCRAFHTPHEWEWIYQQAGYSGDHSYITFE